MCDNESQRKSCDSSRRRTRNSISQLHVAVGLLRKGVNEPRRFVAKRLWAESDRPDPATAPRRSPPGTPPTAAAPTRCAASRYARAGSTSPAANGPRCGGWGGPPRSGVWGTIGSCGYCVWAADFAGCDNSECRNMFIYKHLRLLCCSFAGELCKYTARGRPWRDTDAVAAGSGLNEVRKSRSTSSLSGRDHVLMTSFLPESHSEQLHPHQVDSARRSSPTASRVALGSERRAVAAYRRS